MILKVEPGRLGRRVGEPGERQHRALASRRAPRPRRRGCRARPRSPPAGRGRCSCAPPCRGPARSWRARGRRVVAAVARSREQLAAGPAGEPVVEGELEPRGPGQRPGRKARASASRLAWAGSACRPRRRPRAPAAPTERADAGPSASGLRSAARIAARARRPGAPDEPLARRQPRVDEVRGPGDLAVGERQLRARRRASPKTWVRRLTGTAAASSVLGDVAGAERDLVVVSVAASVVDAPEARQRVLLLGVGVSSAYIAAASSRSQASTNRCAPGASGSIATTIPPANASVATTISGAVRVTMRRRRSAVAPPVLNPPRSARRR